MFTASPGYGSRFRNCTFPGMDIADLKLDSTCRRRTMISFLAVDVSTRTDKDFSMPLSVINLYKAVQPGQMAEKGYGGGSP
ncbi:MAG: hypothetical protein V1793_08220 [Pseudomonadota bacterium]